MSVAEDAPVKYLLPQMLFESANYKVRIVLARLREVSASDWIKGFL